MCARRWGAARLFDNVSSGVIQIANMINTVDAMASMTTAILVEVSLFEQY